MTNTRPVNLWALYHYRDLVAESITAAFDEVENVIARRGQGSVLRSQSDAYALASRFRGLLYKHPYFRKKHIKILRAVVDRCGEAYLSRDVEKLYISKATVNEWIRVFDISPERLQEYLYPLQVFGVLQQSDKQDHLYRVTDPFFSLVGPVARHLVSPTDTRQFAEVMAVVSGLASLYVVGVGTRRRVQLPTAPWFLKLSMTYTLAGLVPGTLTIDGVLSINRIHGVDNYFVMNKGIPVEFWRSVRTEAFEFMTDNRVIEDAESDGYRLNSLWVRVHEGGVKRYVTRVSMRIRRDLGT